MKDFTLVTGLWDLKRGTLTEFGRSFDDYLKNFNNLLSLDFNMCVYVPKELISHVESLRSYHNTRILEYNLEDFKKYFDFFDDVQNIRKKEEWYKQADWLEQSPQAKLEYYNSVCMSKFFLVHNAVVTDQFDSTYYFWIDAGLTSTVNIDLLRNLSSVEDYMKSIKNKFLFLSYPYESDSEVHGFQSHKFAEYCGVEKTNYVCRGGFFGGHRKKIEELNGNYYQIANETLKAGYMGADENLFTIMSHRRSSEIHLFELDDSGLVYPFFEMLGKIKKRTIPNYELIPWDRKKTAEDLKTSLYVLSFNSPQQFDALIKSYIKTDIDFYNRPRKILVDNSTESHTYTVYNELCKKYGFEHIKKEQNLGICGARQFIAEHFNESDSEYYLFLEDDMTLHDKTEDLCEAGYSRYIENLYIKSLEIIHRNRYDFLKLSYSEYHGTNKTQWAWYNVPQSIRNKFFPDKTELPKEGLDPDPPKTIMLCEKRYKDLKYFEGDYYYCNWPLWFSKTGNQKVFLETKWNFPAEYLWMGHIFQLQKQGKVKSAILALSPILHHRFDFYLDDERKES